MDIKKITSIECAEWAAAYKGKYSDTRYNAGLSVRKRIFAIAKSVGVVFEDPMEDDRISRQKVRSKIPAMPSTEMFAEFVKEMAGAGGRFSQDCADFVQGLAFTGMRRGEAKWLVWQHIDFRADRIRFFGDPMEGSKNREERMIPMIPDAKRLFKRMRKERSAEPATSSVLLFPPLPLPLRKCLGRIRAHQPCRRCLLRLQRQVTMDRQAADWGIRDRTHRPEADLLWIRFHAEGARKEMAMLTPTKMRPNSRASAPSNPAIVLSRRWPSKHPQLQARAAFCA